MEGKTIFNPQNNTVFEGGLNKENGTGIYTRPLLNLTEKRKAQIAFKEGKVNQDKALFAGYTNEMQELIPDYISIVQKAGGQWGNMSKREAAIQQSGVTNSKELETLDSASVLGMYVRSAGLGTDIDFTSLNKVVVLQEVLNVQFRAYSLPEAVRQIATPDTLLRYDVATTFNAYSSVGEGVSVDPNHQSYSRTTLVLSKDVAFFGLTDEAQYRFSHPLFQLHVDNTARALRAAWNSSIDTALEGGTTYSASNWDTLSSGLSSNNPFVDVESVQTTITGNGGQPFTAALSEHAYQGLIGNTFIRGAYNNNREPIKSGARVQMNDLFQGVTFYLDNAVTNTKMILFDYNQYLLAANGPTVAFQWRDYNRDADMYKIEHYHTESRAVAGKGRVMTSVHS